VSVSSPGTTGRPSAKANAVLADDWNDSTSRHSCRYPSRTERSAQRSFLTYYGFGIRFSAIYWMRFSTGGISRPRFSRAGSPP
jgi:hypothetical protein